MKANQKGFSVVEILIIIVVIGLLGATGWLVYDRQKNKTDNKDTDSQTSQQEQKQESPKEETKPQENTVKYSTYDKDGIRFEHPEDWKVDSSTSFASIQSPDFAREGLQVMKINSGAFIEASQTDIPQNNRTADNFQTWGAQYVGDTENAKTLTINGQKAIQFDAKHRNGDYAWDATTTVFFRSNGTRVEVRFGYKVDDKQTHNATYQHVLQTMKIE